MPIIIRLEMMYIALTPSRTCGSSKGIFFDTCIIPRMIARLVLDREISWCCCCAAKNYLHLRTDRHICNCGSRKEDECWMDCAESL